MDTIALRAIATNPLPTGRAIQVLLSDTLSQMANDQPKALASLRAAISMVETEAAQGRRQGGLAPWQCLRLMEHIEANIDRMISLAEAAAVVRISPGHLTRAFKQTYGKPFSQHVIAVRVERARDLLLQTRLSIAQIAQACGMNDQSHLTRLFRRHYGAAPSAWRRAFGELTSSVGG